MSWTKTTRPRSGHLLGKPWSPEETERLASAVGRAPSVHNTQPWSLEVQGRQATLWERSDLDLVWHDPQGRDRGISCGAAVANLELAVRGSGWAADVRWADSGDPADPVATVVGSAQRKPTAMEGQRYRAITRRSSYRRAFEDKAVPHATRETLLAAATSEAVTPRWVIGGEQALALARLLAYAARVFQDNSRYQWELAGWTSMHGHDEYGQGIPAEALGDEGLPAVGLATAHTRVPDESLLASRIEQESVLILSTAADERPAHLRAGEAMELAWLSATSLGLAVSVMTQPLQLTEVRTGLAEQLGIPGVPEVVMRFGYPSAQRPSSPLPPQR